MDQVDVDGEGSAKDETTVNAAAGAASASEPQDAAAEQGDNIVMDGTMVDERVVEMQQTWSSWSASIDVGAGDATMQLTAIEHQRVANDQALMEAIMGG